jgi:LeuA allosteric (dimerisation) domain
MTITLAPLESSTLLFDGLPLPRGLREDAETMSWTTFTATYAPSAGPLRLGQWHCTGTDRPATRLGPRTFQATLAVGDRIDTATATANGPVAALTAMLHERGVAVEMLRFHQLQSHDTTATFIQGTDGSRAAWAMGYSKDRTQSALSAVIACANRLYSDEIR